MPISRNGSNHRLYLLGGLLLLWFCVICLRLVYLQIFCYGDFEQRAEKQQQRAVNVSAKRGIIYDRQGNALAMSILVDSAFAVPSEVPDLPNAISLITRISGGDARMVLADCRAHKTFCWVARKANADVVDRIRALNLQGIHFQKESKRFYPKRDLSAQVLGYVGTDDEGLSGIEREYNDQLKGQPGRMQISVDARKKWFGRIEKEPESGDNLVLTIDEKIQYIAERELEQAIKDTQAIAGTVIVENPHTGEVLALANRPTFNPNVKKEIKNENMKNRAVSDIYEPGSTFKLVTISGALEEKLTNPNELFDCQMGSIVINGMRIRDSKPHGVLTVTDVLAESSDVGAIKIALRLGEDRFYKYIRAYGFGQQTGIELPGETRGMTKPVNKWSKVSIGAISMGQEIGVSAVQLAAMVSTFGNDGVWVAPRIVAETTPPQGALQNVAFHPQQERRVISPMTAAQMRQMMRRVVLHGTGRKAVLEGYTSAGKTGTAQKVDPDTGAYSRTKYVGSFAGFAPINNPAVTVAVILDSAIGLHQGGQIAAPVFRRITQQVLEYLHVPHDLQLPPNRQVWLAQNKVRDADLDESSPDHLGSALEVADSAPADTTPLPAPPKPSAAQGAVVPASLKEKVPAAREPVAAAQPAKETPEPPPSNGTVVLDVEQGGIEVPSFIGKSVRGAIETAQDTGLELNPVGSGIAREQSPVPGTHVTAGSRVIVKFGR
ncbi:MAG TPA: penicillin-binding transpeptidase domain-containing protein [Terriglobales bacterium]|nr:penicillin-binding transpeptidase domain-containing protein [Terriglobales bacterium]